MKRAEVKQLLESIKRKYTLIDIDHDMKQIYHEYWEYASPECKRLVKKYCKELDGYIKQNEREVISLSQKVRKLDDVECTILFLRYFCMFKWEDIAEKVGYSFNHTQTLHNKALDNLGLILG